jgi:hypothetical protein
LKEDGRKINKVAWDMSKIQGSFSDSERDDPLLHFNIVTGKIISGKLWPLIFDQSDDPLVSKRTIKFMKQTISEPQQLKQLNEQQARYFFVGVRDLWLAESRGLLSEDEKKTLGAVLEQLDDEFVPCAEHQSVSFSFCPSKHRRVLKFIEKINELGDFDDQLLETIATMKVSADQFYAVWVDAQDLSYNNFESILPLDRALHLNCQPGHELPTMEFSLNSITRPNKDMHVVRCQLQGPGTKSLLALDGLGLYQTPSNASTRGGQRFIFSSTVLSRGLTQAIKQSNLFKVLSTPQSKFYEKCFQSVNYVFRCNKFAPGDNKFEMHMDTPYYDSVRKQISSYTMLIYLSNGKGNPALSIVHSTEEKKVEFDELSTLDCVIFDHQYPHEGQAFVDSDKIFLRTELIFTNTHVEHAPAVSKLFSSAVYYTLQSTFQPDYSRHAHELYERVNKAHWRLNDDTQSQVFEPIVLHKSWNGLHFATNGNDYWFPHVTEENNNHLHQLAHEQRESYLKMIATIAVLDYFNCRYGEQVENNNVLKTFRKECSSEQISVPNDVESKSGWIMSYLWSQISKESKHGEYIELTDAEKKEKYFNQVLPSARYRLPEGQTADQCCPMCNHDDFVPWKCGYMMTHYGRDVEKNLRYLKGAPIILLDNKLQFDPAGVKIEDDKLYFHLNNDGNIACNFAGTCNIRIDG